MSTYITLYKDGTDEVIQSLRLTPKMGKMEEEMTQIEWTELAEEIKTASGLSYVWGLSKANDMVSSGTLVPRPTPNLTIEQLQAQASALVDLEYSAALSAITNGYPLEERESWPVQTSEARLLVANFQASTPWIDAAAQSRGLSRTDLAQRIIALDEAYRRVHGRYTGTRQDLQNRIAAATTREQLIPLVWPTSWD